MPWQDIAIWALGLGGLAGGWFLRTIWDAVAQLRDNLSRLESSLPNVYARRDDVRDMFRQVLEAVNQLRVRIDSQDS